jgi:hypothetical protein
MAEDEGDLLVATGVGQPVPAVHALAGDEETVAEGFDGAEEGVGVGGEVFGEDDVAALVEDDEEEVPGVEIDAGVESGGGRWSEATHGKGLLRKGDWRRANLHDGRKAFMSIPAPRPTSGASRLWEVHSCPAAPAGKLVVPHR